MIGDDETLHPQALRHDEEEVARAGRRLGGVVLGDGAAGDDAAVQAQRRERGLERRPADVVEVDVDAVPQRLACRRPRGSRTPRRSRAPRSQATFSGEPALPITGSPSASRSDRRPSRRRRQRPRRRPSRPPSAGRRRAARRRRSAPASRARRAQSRPEPSAGSNDAAGRAVRERELAPAEIVRRPTCPPRTGRCARRSTCPTAPPVSASPSCERRHVRLDVVHPAAHVRVDRDERVPDQHLPVAGIRHVDLDEREVARLRAPRGAGRPDGSRGSLSCEDPTGCRDRHNVSVESLRGQLLVAGPDLLDPNFRRSVLLVGEHGEEGAMGVILNRPSPVSVADAVPPLAELVDDDELVHVGGPVQPQAIVVLGDFRDPDEAAALVLGSIGFLPGEIETRGRRRQPRAGPRLRGLRRLGARPARERDRRGVVDHRAGPARRTSSPTSPTRSGAPSSRARAARSRSWR